MAKYSEDIKTLSKAKQICSFAFTSEQTFVQSHTLALTQDNVPRQCNVCVCAVGQSDSIHFNAHNRLFPLAT